MKESEEQNQKIAKKFDKFLAKKLTAITDGQEQVISYSYGKNIKDQIEKNAMTIALIFWQFMRKRMSRTSLCSDKKRMDFIFDFILNNPLAQENRYVKIIAMVEALPTTIFRKLLWRENIDFAGYEPFLRRLNEEQIKAIEDNYQDLFGSTSPVIPRVLKKSWRDRVKIFFGLTSVPKILNEPCNYYNRYLSKGAYAFNFLGLDFGFSQFPKGDNDDTKLTNKKYTRFLSIKEHVNDYQVNFEDGKYWWLYKTARSNYAIRPKAEVEIRDHICPGFWITLIIHSLFWIVSPIALVTTSLVIAVNGFSSVALIPLALASVLIIWTVIAIFRAVSRGISHLTRKSKVAETIGDIIKVVLAVSVIGWIIYNIIKFLWFCISGLAGVCGPLLAVLFVLAAAFYVVYFLTCIIRSEPAFDYKDIPSFIRFLLHISVLGFAIVMFDKFLAEAVINFIVTVAQAFWEWYTSDLLLSNWFILALIFFGLFIYFYNMFLKNEGRFATLQKTFTWLSKGFVAITVIVFAILFVKTETLNVVDFGLLPAFALSFIFLAFATALIMLDQVNPGNIEERIMASAVLTKINKKIDGLAYKTYINRLLKSEWLMPLERNQKWETIYRISDLSFEFFRNDREYRTNFTNLMISDGSVEIIDILSAQNITMLVYDYDCKEVYQIIEMIVAGRSTEEAIDEIQANRAASQKIMRRTKTIILKIVFPFIISFKAIAWIFRKIGQFFGTLKDLWDFFNNRCPYISRPRFLG